ncbi:MAG: threonine--tRNA ligase [Bacilli bacterium]
MKITLPDKSVKEIPEGSLAIDAAKSIAISLAEKAICAKVDGELFDLKQPLKGDCEFEVVLKNSADALHVLRHSAAHLMAQAISHLYPGTMFAYGPATEEGFYYDMKLPENQVISESDFAKIEAEMKKIVSENLPIVREELSPEEAKQVFAGQKYKLVHIDELADKGASLSAYRQGDYSDLCLGPHMKSTGQIKAVKIMSTSACYFKGDKNNDTLTRVYGTAFFAEADLQAYLTLLEQRKESDHKKIGREMGLFMISDYGPGFPFWLPNGMLLRHELEDYLWNLMIENGYNWVKTPTMLSRELWETSGHWKEYKQNMYITKIDGKPFAVKPMNCPGAILCYNSEMHSYHDLPLRFAEFGLVHRHEASGALNGLFRVRCFTQDDAHIFLAFEQVGDEIRKLLKIFDSVYKLFNLEYHIELSTRPEDEYVGKIETWNKAEAELIQCLNENKIPYEINPGDGAFYGPKLDFKFKDSLGRIWQCGTIQLDMQLPHRFHISYVDKNGKKKEPVMLHRAIFGSIERFVGIITENFKGAFPTWMAPEQLRIIPVNTEDTELMAYCTKLNKRLLKKKVRCSIDDRYEKMGFKIRDSQSHKVPYTVVVGANELKDKTLTYRLHGERTTKTVSEAEFIKTLLKDISTKACTRSY